MGNFWGILTPGKNGRIKREEGGKRNLPQIPGLEELNWGPLRTPFKRKLGKETFNGKGN